MTARTKNIIMWVIIAFVTFVFCFVGISKLLGTASQIEKLNGWGFPLWTRFPIGIVELLLGVGLLFQKTRKVTIYLILVWGVFAIITYVQAGQIVQAGLPLLLALIAGSLLPISKIKTVG